MCVHLCVKNELSLGKYDFEKSQITRCEICILNLEPDKTNRYYNAIE